MYQTENDLIACWDQVKFFNRMSHNMSIIKQLIDLFLEDNEFIVENINTAVKNEDSNTLLNLAHKAKGSAKNLSFDAVAHTLELIELSVKTNGVVHIEDSLQKFIQEYNKLVSVLNEYLQSHSSN